MQARSSGFLQAGVALSPSGILLPLAKAICTAITDRNTSKASLEISRSLASYVVMLLSSYIQMQEELKVCDEVIVVQESRVPRSDA